MSSCLFCKRKKKVKKSSESQTKNVDKTKRLYFAAEYKTFADTTGDGQMGIEEFYRLMTLLGYPEGTDGARHLWQSKGKSMEAKISRDEYINMMLDPEVDAKTNMWRKLFGQMDTDGSGFASKSDVLHGLENMGLTIDDSLKAKVDKMDTNKDRKISYDEFLKAQLKE